MCQFASKKHPRRSISWLQFAPPGKRRAVNSDRSRRARKIKRRGREGNNTLPGKKHLGSVMKRRRQIRWGNGDGVDVSAVIGLNQGMGVQVFTELHDLSVPNLKQVRPLVVEVTS